jgi:FAD/FMN-containing dehydrogenase
MNEFPPIHGTVLMADDEAFADEIAGYNRLLKHRPAYVVVAADAQDIVTAVRFAAERGLPIGVQATGHGPSTPADGGVLVSKRFLRTSGRAP